MEDKPVVSCFVAFSLLPVATAFLFEGLVSQSVTPCDLNVSMLWLIILYSLLRTQFKQERFLQHKNCNFKLNQLKTNPSVLSKLFLPN